MTASPIAILDYGIGNIRSISNAVESVGAVPLLTRDPSEIITARALIFPGVGAFSHGMDNLAAFDLIDVIHRFVQTGKPFLGICLGMQMLFDGSEEFGNTRGLGLIKGMVRQMPFSSQGTCKLPHIRWNSIREPHSGRWDNTLLAGTTAEEEMYFVHSFVGMPERQEDVLATTDYGDCRFCSAVQHDNIYGMQFHPEKSRASGLRILRNFTQLTLS
ncbi:MAG: imidazole glycerol phosphate synthase subunit HisH [Luteolibacter sp.]|uniref:imidazole glycerol phosphate synthase subunit HisH n=1 Tax=Luteolibacter sp. TaxID=1962973 RepID=UPI003265EA3A